MGRELHWGHTGCGAGDLPELLPFATVLVRPCWGGSPAHPALMPSGTLLLWVWLLGTGRTRPLPGEGALPGKGSQNSRQTPREEMSWPIRVPACPQQAAHWLSWNSTPLQHQASVSAPRFNTLLENERLEHVPEEKEIYCCPGPAAKQNSNNPGAGRTINPCWQSHC